MKPESRMKTAGIGIAILMACFASQANAGCSAYDSPSVAPAAAKLAPAVFGLNGFQGIELRKADYRDGGDQRDWPWSDLDPIVGLWKIQFVAKGNSGPGAPPDGAILDDGYATWHADGTEIMNSSRPPITSSFCMGVWKKVGRSTYSLNHVALSWDGTGTVFVGPASIREVVTVDNHGNSFSGTVTLTQYAIDGATVLGAVSGTVSGLRVKP
jgi:hypothetical protein